MIPILAFHPPVIACRGARSPVPENTLASLRAVREQGSIWVAVDVKITHDGVPILMRDETLDRTTNGKGLVADTHWETVRTLDAGSWFDKKFANETVPHLADVVHTVLECGLMLNIELNPCRGRAMATTMVTLIEMAKIWPDKDVFPLISSFDVECLTIAAQLQPHWPRGLLLNDWRDNWGDVADMTKSSVVSIKDEHMTRERYDLMAKERLPLLCHSIKNSERARELLSWGVNAVFYDNPREVLESA